MSEFHENIRRLLEGIYTFLTETLHQELLSSTALTGKEAILFELQALHQKYPQLHLNLSSSSFSNEQQQQQPLASPVSPTSYIDMQGGTIVKGQSDVLGMEESYEVCGSEKSGYADSQAFMGSDDGRSQSDYRYAPLPATELQAFEKYGFLEKKGRERLGGLITMSQRRWCCIKDSLMYYYESKSDKAQKGVISLAGYEVRPIPQMKDSKKKKSNFYFELVCPGRQTYQFGALSENDQKQWVAAIERINKGNEKSLYQEDISPSSGKVDKRVSLVYDDSDYNPEEIYELVEGDEEHNADHKRKSISSQHSSNFKIKADHIIEEPCLNENERTLTQMCDYRNLYFGLWDCTGSDDTELDFKYGDVIHILNKQYDSYDWWIGELNGKVGFVPKPYLMEVYSIN